MKRTQKENQVPTEVAYAYHEAGHAVMAILLGYGVDLVAIKEHAVTYVEDSRWDHEIMIDMAGDVAVRHFIDPREFSWIARSDGRLVTKVLNRKRLHGAERKQVRAKLRDRVERSLISDQRNRSKVEKLAKALQESSVLFTDQIREVLPAAHPSKDWPPRSIEERNRLYGLDSSFAFVEWINELIPIREFRNEAGERVKHRYEVNVYNKRGRKLRTIACYQSFAKGLNQATYYWDSDSFYPNGEQRVFMYDCGTGEYYDECYPT